MQFKDILARVVLNKVKGGALYIAIMVGIIIGIILVMFISLASFNQRTLTKHGQTSQLYFNLKSALEIAQSAYFTENNNGRWFKNTYNDDSIRVEKAYWGAYMLIVSETKNRHTSLYQAGLYGSAMSSDTGIVTSDKSRAIGMSGNVVLKANCYVSSAGIKPAFIEGQSYMGSGQNVSFIKAGPSQIQDIDQAFKNGILAQQREVSLSNDSLVQYIAQSMNQSFRRRTVLWETGAIHLKSINLSNNIKIVCHAGIELDSSCHFDNVLIVCDKVRFKQGFKGSVHVIARDSIIAEGSTEFLFPSSFVLSTDGQNTNDLKCIVLGEETKFSGGIIAFRSSEGEAGEKVFVKLNKSSEVNGLLYSADYLHVEGKLNANVFCNTLLLKTPSAVYENHILACEVDPRKFSHLISVPMVFKKTNRLLACKNCNDV